MISYLKGVTVSLRPGENKHTCEHTCGQRCWSSAPLPKPHCWPLGLIMMCLEAWGCIFSCACMLACCRGVFLHVFFQLLLACVAVGVSGKPCSRGSAEEQVGLPVLWKRAALWPLEWVRSYFLLSCGLTLWEVWLLNEAPLLPPFSQAAWKLHQSCWRWNRMTVGAKSYIWMRFQRTCDP